MCVRSGRSCVAPCSTRARADARGVRRSSYHLRRTRTLRRQASPRSSCTSARIRSGLRGSCVVRASKTLTEPGCALSWRAGPRRGERRGVDAGGASLARGLADRGVHAVERRVCWESCFHKPTSAVPPCVHVPPLHCCARRRHVFQLRDHPTGARHRHPCPRVEPQRKLAHLGCDICHFECVRLCTCLMLRIAGDDGGVVKYWQPNMNNVKATQAHKEPVCRTYACCVLPESSTETHLARRCAACRLQVPTSSSAPAPTTRPSRSVRPCLWATQRGDMRACSARSSCACAPCPRCGTLRAASKNTSW